MHKGHGWNWFGRVSFEGHYPFVAQHVLQMTFVDHERDLSTQRNAFFYFVTIFVMELAPFWLIFMCVGLITLS